MKLYWSVIKCEDQNCQKVARCLITDVITEKSEQALISSQISGLQAQFKKYCPNSSCAIFWSYFEYNTHFRCIYYKMWIYTALNIARAPGYLDIHKYYSILKQLRSHFLDYFKKNKTHIFLPFIPISPSISISEIYIMSRTQTLSTTHLISMINSIQVTSMCSLSPTNINTYDFLCIFSQVPLLSVIAFLSFWFDLQPQPLHSHDILKVSSKILWTLISSVYILL